MHKKQSKGAFESTSTLLTEPLFLDLILLKNTCFFRLLFLNLVEQNLTWELYQIY